MSASSSIVLALALVATTFALWRLAEVRVLLSIEESLVITEKGSRDVFSFATHYFFSLMLLCISGTTTESSIFLEVAPSKTEKIIRLVCFLGLTLATLIVFV